MSWSPGLVYKEFSTVTITNSTAKTEVFSFIVPGGFLDESNILQITIDGIISQGTGVTRSFTPYLEYTTSSGVISQGVAGQELEPGTMGSRTLIEVWPKNDTSAVGFYSHLQGNTDVSTTSAVSGPYIHRQQLNLDFSENITVKFYVALSTASASFSWDKVNANVILL